MPMLTKDSAIALRLDQKPDGKHILFKIVAIPGQFVVHFLNGQEEAFWGISEARLAKLFGAQTVDSGWMPPGVCRWGRLPTADWMLRLYPAACYTLQFGTPEHQDAFSLSVHLPGIAFVGLGSTYYVWAVKEQQFSSQMPLFAAPLPNVYQDGRICYGSNRVPAVSIDNWKTIETAWQIFIGSPFIGDLAAQKSRAHPGDVRPHLVEVAKLGEQPYPLDDLVPHVSGGLPVTLQQGMSALLQRHRS